MPLDLISRLMVLILDILTGKVNLNMHVSQMVLKATFLKERKNIITISEVELFGISLLLKCDLCYSSCFKT